VVSEFELKVLREVNGEPQEGLQWGAAMSAAIEFLQADGLVTRGSDIRITEKGKKLINGLS
jgi:predicted methyltransferase